MENSEDQLTDIWISNWESQCEIELENEPHLESQVQSERDLAMQKLWHFFQNSATAVAQLFKDRSNQSQVPWLPFQNAAGTITSLYIESTEVLRRNSDLASRAGYQRRAREVLAWAKKKRRHIRREELISFLAGKNLPETDGSRDPHHQRVGLQDLPNLLGQFQFCLVNPRVCLEGAKVSQHHTHHTLPLVDMTGCADFEPTLQNFQEALSSPPFMSATASEENAGRSRASPIHNGSELSTFITNQLAQLKRPASSSGSPTHDAIMDSQTHKRPRLM